MVLVELLKSMDPKVSYIILAGMLFALALIMSLMVKEIKIERSYKKESFL
jgi:hypothetical protein